MLKDRIKKFLGASGKMIPFAQPFLNREKYLHELKGGLAELKADREYYLRQAAPYPVMAYLAGKTIVYYNEEEFDGLLVRIEAEIALLEGGCTEQEYFNYGRYPFAA